MSWILTRVPSKLLKIALRDMKATIEQGYKIKMSSWGSGDKRDDDRNDCSVCFAGSIMLQTTNNKEDSLDSFDHQGENEDQFSFLDQIRKGDLRGAMQKLEIEVNVNKYEGFASNIEDWLEYDECTNDEQFYNQVEGLIVYLESKNH